MIICWVLQQLLMLVQRSRILYAYCLSPDMLSVRSSLVLDSVLKIGTLVYTWIMVGHNDKSRDLVLTS